ncbi:unnamed protein product [Tenebrio molitor]|nr:unnamed protein product [Tenebrio molitor]
MWRCPIILLGQSLVHHNFIHLNILLRSREKSSF